MCCDGECGFGLVGVGGDDGEGASVPDVVAMVEVGVFVLDVGIAGCEECGVAADAEGE